MEGTPLRSLDEFGLTRTAAVTASDRSGLQPVRRHRVACALCLLLATAMTPAASVDDDPAAVIDGLHAALTAAGDDADFASRFRLLAPAIDASHDFKTIARLVGGRFWPSLDEQDRSRFRDAFRRASIATYTSRFASTGDLRFDAAETLQRDDARSTVRSHLIRPDGSKVVFEYVLQRRQGRWLIVTILVDGVSDLALQRANLTRLYQSGGLPVVFDYLEEMAAGGQEGLRKTGGVAVRPSEYPSKTTRVAENSTVGTNAPGRLGDAPRTRWRPTRTDPGYRVPRVSRVA